MWEKKKTFLCEKLKSQIIYENTTPSRMQNLIPYPTPCLECRVHLVTCFQRTEYEKRRGWGGEYLTME